MGGKCGLLCGKLRTKHKKEEIKFMEVYIHMRYNVSTIIGKREEICHL